MDLKGSVLGPKLYTNSVGDIVRRHGMHYHGYADDHQLYLFATPGERWSESLDLVEKCVAEIGRWMADNMLCLNMEKNRIHGIWKKGMP